MKLLKSIYVFIILYTAISGIGESIFAQAQKPGESGKFVDLLKLTATGNGYSDQTIIIFIPEATPGFDPQYDAYKLPGSTCARQLYSIIPGTNLAVNALPEILVNLVVQLGFKVGVSTNYSITATELNSFDPSVTIFLEDTKDGIMLDMKSNPVYTFSATPTDIIERFKLYFRYPVHLNLNVFLEGCFNGTEMSTYLNQAGLLPLNQPYDSSPWNYYGTENVSFIPNPDVVDWVLVEIRDTTDVAFANNGTSIERKAGFLLKNGSIVDFDGSSQLSFKQTIYENMYVCIWHRNHLGIISSSSPMESSGIYYYDFTTGVDQAYGGINGQKEIAPGVFGMVGGDANTDGTVNYADIISTWMLQAGLTGYLQSDVNLDSQVDNKDKDALWFYNMGYASQIPE